MKIFKSDQIKEIDNYTIRNEPVSSADLMERAAGCISNWFTSRFNNALPVMIFVGPGNNGGDGLALARMLFQRNYKPDLYFVGVSEKTSDDWRINKVRLEKECRVPFNVIKDIKQIPAINPGSVIIDAIFGSGLSRKADGIAAEVIRQINNSGATVISVDIPSGLFGEDNGNNDPDTIIKARFTLSFQFPKLSFMFHDNYKFVGDWIILPIGLHQEAIANTETSYNYLEKGNIKPLLKQRNKYDHKGTYGHGLIIGGSSGKMGSIVLGARAALKTGIGLITCHIPSGGDTILQSAVPEAMVVSDENEHIVTGPLGAGFYSAIGIGPGMGTDNFSKRAFAELLGNCKLPLVIDADALNIISENKELSGRIPQHSILTPHPKEFERLAGKSSTGFERLQNQVEYSKNHNCILILKGANTSITSPDGRVWFNSTGNPGMATAGSGDVLTGMILSLLAQGYKPIDAAITGVYLHGLAGDLAALNSGYESLIASDIINNIGPAYSKINDRG
jgi:hydroxyethylthiazole kinase-like uncharacterized protein yjeF